MTIVIIVFTVIFSLAGFSNKVLFSKYSFKPYAIKNNQEWYRFFTYAFIHVDILHFVVNMFVLYSFGRVVEYSYKYLFGVKAYLFYLLLYVGGILFSVVFDFGKYKNNAYYSAVGASGAVSAIVFSSIIISPLDKIYIFFIPIGIPAFIFGIIYLIYSAYMAKNSKDNIGHNAHFWGAVFGIAFTLILKPNLFVNFLNQIIK